MLHAFSRYVCYSWKFPPLSFFDHVTQHHKFLQPFLECFGRPNFFIFNIYAATFKSSNPLENRDLRFPMLYPQNLIFFNKNYRIVSPNNDFIHRTTFTKHFFCFGNSRDLQTTCQEFRIYNLRFGTVETSSS